MNIALVVNSRSGGGKGRRMGQAIARELTRQNINFTEVREKSLDSSLQSLARIHAKDPFSTIISVGGDGLAHHLFAYAIEWNLPILVAPAGTGNDFARSTGSFGLKAVELVELLVKQKPTRIDMGEIRQGEKSHWFGQVLSTGFDSLVNERANRIKGLSGKLKYVYATFRELPFFVPRTYTVEIDGDTVITGSMLMAIANGRSYGGGMLVCPDARFDDGLFDILLLKPIPIREFIRVFPRVFKGTHVRHPAVEIRRCSKISLSADAIAYADGERIGQLPISAKVHPSIMQTWIVS